MVEPHVERSWWLQLFLAVTSGVLAIGLLAGVVFGVSLWLATTSTQVGLGLVVGCTVALLLLLVGLVIDHARELDRYELRLGEGWLVLRFVDQGSELRIDLTRVRTAVATRQDLRLVDLGGETMEVPMGGHSLDEVRWLSMALEHALQDAHVVDAAPPVELLRMHRPQ